MKLEFIELDLEWPSELRVVHLKNYILSRLIEYGEPLRWAITSVATNSEKRIQIISVEVIFLVYQEKEREINPELN